MFQFVLFYIFMPMLVLGLVIFVHELGHFLMARYFKIPVSIFSVGFGKEIWGRVDRHGTRWKLSLFPLGGYVSVNSQDSDPLYQRAMVAVAGPIANFLLAILIMIMTANILGMPAMSPSIVALNINGGAYAAGVLPGDKIISLNGESIPHDIDRIKDMIVALKKSDIEAVIERKGQKKTLNIPIKNLPKVGDFGENKKEKMMGVVFAGQNWKLSAVNSVAGVTTEGNIASVRSEFIKNMGRHIIVNFGKANEREDFLVFVDPDLNQDLFNPAGKKYSSFILWDDSVVHFVPVSFFKSVSESLKIVYTACQKTLGVLYQIINGKKDTGDLGGVVAISTMTGEVSERMELVGPYFILRLIAILSINIGFINLLPLPMLDGGHLLFYAIEFIRGRPASLKVKGYVYGVSIMFIIGLMLMVTYRDILEKFAGN